MGGWVTFCPHLRDETFKKRKAHANETVLKINPANLPAPRQMSSPTLVPGTSEHQKKPSSHFWRSSLEG